MRRGLGFTPVGCGHRVGKGSKLRHRGCFGVEGIIRKVEGWPISLLRAPSCQHTVAYTGRYAHKPYSGSKGCPGWASGFGPGACTALSRLQPGCHSASGPRSPPGTCPDLAA